MGPGLIYGAGTGWILYTVLQIDKSRGKTKLEWPLSTIDVTAERGRVLKYEMSDKCHYRII